MSTNDPASAAGHVSMTVLVYSHDRQTREQVRLALGRRPAPELPQIQLVEAATQPAVMRLVDEGGIDVVVLDGEAIPAGGMGVCRTLKEEVFQSPPVLLLTGRPQDAWLATWSRADAVVAHPLDAFAVAEAVAGLMRARVAAGHVRRSS